MLAGLLVVVSGAAWGINYEWIGSTDTVWTTAGNWAGGTAPSFPIGAGNTLIINSTGSNNPAPSGMNDITVDALTITLGILNMNGNDLTVSGNITNSDTLSNVGTLTLNGTTAITGAVSADSLVLTGTISGGGTLTISENLTVTGTTPAVPSGILKYSPAVDITISSGAVSMAAVTLNGNITTDGNQTYTGTVTLGTNVTLTANGGDIALNDDINGSTHDLTIDAGTGNVSIGTAGTPSTQIAGDIAITAATVTINGSGGNGAHIQPGGTLTVTGDTVNNGAITAGPVSAGSPALIFNGDYTSSASGSLAGNSTTDPDIQFGGDVTLGAFAHNGDRLVFAAASPQNLSIASSAAPVMGDVLIKTGAAVTVQSGSTMQQDNNMTLELEDETTSGAGDGGVLETAGGSWYMGNGALQAGNNFTGYWGTLNLGAGTTLNAGNLNLLGNSAAQKLTVTNAGPALISVAGDVVIQGAMAVGPDPDYDIDTSNTFVDFSGGGLPSLVLEMTGSGKNLTAGQPLGSLTITTAASVSLLNKLSVRGAVVLNDPGVLAAGSYDVAVYAGLEGTRDLTNNRHGTNDAINYARWEVVNGTPGVMSAFTQSMGGKVSFRRDSAGAYTTEPVFFEIVGNTTWNNFVCTERGDSAGTGNGPAVLQFSRNPDQHAFLETFNVKVDVPAGNGPGQSGQVPLLDYITITRYDSTPSSTSLYKYTYYTGGTFDSPSAPSSPAVPPGAEDLPIAPPPVTLSGAEANKFWNFNLISPGTSGSPVLNIQCVNVYFSRAYNQKVSIGFEKMCLNVIPFYQTPDGYFNYDWIALRKIIYGFTEDGDGNGKIDRIRVQTIRPLNGDFSRFNVKVQGYELDRTLGSGGFQRVGDVTGESSDADSFYIYLQEQPYYDGGNTPRWDVIENTSLMDALTQTSFIGDPAIDRGIQTFDTVPPRIRYALTLPDHPHIYVRMPEPLVPETGGTLPSVSFGLTLNIVSAAAVDTSASRIFTYEYVPAGSAAPALAFNYPIDSAPYGYLLDLSAAYTVSDLAALPPLYGGSVPTETFVVSDMLDQGIRAMDWQDPAVDPVAWEYYPSPKYPVDWNYSQYAAFSGNAHLRGRGHVPEFADDAADGVLPDGSPIAKADILLPPHKLLTVAMTKDLHDGTTVNPVSFASPNNVERRVTDLLISCPPAAAGDTAYFVWPVWARYTTPPNTAAPPGSDFWGGQGTDLGLIWDFNGTRFLEDRDSTLQARLNSGLSGTVSLFFGLNVPEHLRNPPLAKTRGGGSGGLWLPPPQTADPKLFDAAPDFAGISAPAPTGTSPLFDFSFLNSDYASGDRLDFLFHLGLSADPDLHVARLDAPVGIVPGDWYRRVRPFSFDIKDVIQQRGGASVLNNVINPGNGEKAYIRYQLASGGRVTIQVFTLDGNLVKIIRRNEYRDAGEWTDYWDGKNNGGRAVARGMYFIRIVGPGIDEIRKIMVVK
jgi:hypothetical protein